MVILSVLLLVYRDSGWEGCLIKQNISNFLFKFSYLDTVCNIQCHIFCCFSLYWAQISCDDTTSEDYSKVCDEDVL
jgi:hypothetical protein